MAGISVVIITKNEEHNIVDCIQSARLLTDDIVIVDSGSSDATVELARKQGAKIIAVQWEGYGTSKNRGAAEAKNNWIFSLDADERITPQLAQAIKNLSLKNNNSIYQFKRTNYFGNKRVGFGAEGFDKVIRFYNRLHATWDPTLVHEKLAGNCIQKKINCSLNHYCAENLEDYREKLIRYARLSAAKYFSEKRNAAHIKLLVSPMFNSIKSYIFQLGFLNGATGLKLARLTAYYTWLKYYYLHQLNRAQTLKKELDSEVSESAGKPVIAFSGK